MGGSTQDEKDDDIINMGVLRRDVGVGILLQSNAFGVKFLRTQCRTFDRWCTPKSDDTNRYSGYAKLHSISLAFFCDSWIHVRKSSKHHFAARQSIARFEQDNLSPKIERGQWRTTPKQSKEAISTLDGR